jgi:hypothetical protein
MLLAGPCGVLMLGSISPGLAPCDLPILNVENQKSGTSAEVV